MFSFDKVDMQRFAVSSLGALALSAACVIGAVGPAKAASPRTVADWQDKVERRLGTIRETNAAYQPSKLMVSEVAVHFTADGDYAGAALAKSSGSRLVDSRAVAVARSVRYPMLPEAFRGEPMTVRMILYFGEGAEAQAAYDALQERARNPQIASAGGAGIRIAAR